MSEKVRQSFLLENEERMLLLEELAGVEWALLWITAQHALTVPPPAVPHHAARVLLHAVESHCQLVRAARGAVLVWSHCAADCPLVLAEAMGRLVAALPEDPGEQDHSIRRGENAGGAEEAGRGR